MQVELQFNGQETIEGETAEAVVETMSTYQWPDHGKSMTIRDYMHTVSTRIKTQGQAKVRWCCATHFLEDLATCRVIKKIVE